MRVQLKTLRSKMCENKEALAAIENILYPMQAWRSRAAADKNLSGNEDQWNVGEIPAEFFIRIHNLS